MRHRRELTQAYREQLARYQEKHRQVFLQEWPSLQAAMRLAEQQRVAATRDCLVTYVRLDKQAPHTTPFAATLAAARDVTDACAAACHWTGPTPPLPVFRDPRRDYDAQPLPGILDFGTHRSLSSDATLG